MNMVLREIKNNILWLTLNRVDKHNAFNEALLAELEQAIYEGIDLENVHVLVLKANGKYFSTGADLVSMEAIAKMPFEQNKAQALQLANVLQLWHTSPKPTLCLIQGDVYGGALGFVAASDVAIASTDTQFCFSEARLGLIPAIISPYILKTIGKKQTKKLFLSAEKFNTQKALDYQLIDEIVPKEDLLEFGEKYAMNWVKLPQPTLQLIKSWLNEIENTPISSDLSLLCSEKLAKIRSSEPAKTLLKKFLEHQKGS